MVNDAELNAQEDRKKVELAQARNQAEAMLHNVKKSLAEHGAHLDGTEKQAVEGAIKKLEEALEGEDKLAIEEKTKTLTAASQTLGEKAHAQSQAAGAAQAPADEDVLDAEVKEV